MFFGFNKDTVVVLIGQIVVELIDEKDVSLINESIDPFIGRFKYGFIGKGIFKFGFSVKINGPSILRLNGLDFWTFVDVISNKGNKVGIVVAFNEGTKVENKFGTVDVFKTGFIGLIWGNKIGFKVVVVILKDDEMLVVIVLFKNGFIERFNVGNKVGNKVGIAVIEEFKGVLEFNNGEIVIVLFKNGLIKNGFNVGNKGENKVERVVVILFKGKVGSNVVGATVVVIFIGVINGAKVGNKVEIGVVESCGIVVVFKDELIGKSGGKVGNKFGNNVEVVKFDGIVVENKLGIVGKGGINVDGTSISNFIDENRAVVGITKVKFEILSSSKALIISVFIKLSKTM